MTHETITWLLEIQALKARYFRFLDRQDWMALKALFTPDATLFFPEAQSEPVGLDAAIMFMASGMEGCTSIHHGHMPELEILSPERARGIWAMEDRVFWPSDHPSALGLRSLHGFGHYHEEYERRGDGWLIHRLRLDRLHATAVPTGDPAPLWADVKWDGGKK